MTRIGLAALPLLPLVLAACELLRLLTPAGQACAAAALSYSGTVVGSFATTVGAIRALGFYPAGWSGYSRDHPAVLCYVDGQIAKSPPGVHDPFDRVVVGIVDGHSDMLVAGYRDGLPVQAP